MRQAVAVLVAAALITGCRVGPIGDDAGMARDARSDVAAERDSEVDAAPEFADAARMLDGGPPRVRYACDPTVDPTTLTRTTEHGEATYETCCYRLYGTGGTLSMAAFAPLVRIDPGDPRNCLPGATFTPNRLGNDSTIRSVTTDRALHCDFASAGTIDCPAVWLVQGSDGISDFRTGCCSDGSYEVGRPFCGIGDALTCWAPGPTATPFAR